MTITEILSKTSIKELDAEIFLAHVLETDRSWILAHPEKALTQAQKSTFEDYIKRRTAGEPIAYITGEKEFYGHLFNINPSVLIPRPSTEGLIDLALDFLKTKNGEVREVDNGIVCISKYLNKCSNIKTIVDVGTGSGCIAITLALELPEMKFIATDISAEALEVACNNAKIHGVQDRIVFKQGSGLKPVEDLDEPFLIVSNPPYIPKGENLMKEVQFEPEDALFAGENGMDVIRKLVDEAQNDPNCCGYVLECRKEQVSSLLD